MEDTDSFNWPEFELMKHDRPQDWRNRHDIEYAADHPAVLPPGVKPWLQRQHAGGLAHRGRPVTATEPSTLSLGMSLAVSSVSGNVAD